METTMDTVEILTKARELISDESRWTQGWYAKDAIGEKCTALHKDAVCFCALGAIKQVGGFLDDCNPAANFLAHVLRTEGESGSVDDFNDEHSHTDVLALFDRAIAAARAA